MGLTLFSVSALGALLYLDRVILGRWMFSRPIVLAPLLGGLWGEAQAGILIGIVLEAIWLHRLPVGSTIPPDESFMAVLAIGSFVISRRYLGISWEEGIALATFLALPGSRIGPLLDGFVRRWNVHISQFQKEEIDKDRLRIAENINWLGVLNSYFVFFIGFFVFMGVEVGGLYLIQPWITAPLWKGFFGTFRCLPLLGVASILLLNRGVRSWFFWGAGYGLASLLLWIFKHGDPQ